VLDKNEVFKALERRWSSSALVSSRVLGVHWTVNACDDAAAGADHAQSLPVITITIVFDIDILCT
jgi:hypothetical protein